MRIVDDDDKAWVRRETARVLKRRVPRISNLTKEEEGGLGVEVKG